MQSNRISTSRFLLPASAAVFCAVTLLSARAHAQLYLAASQEVGEYDATTGVAINASLVPSPPISTGIAVGGGWLFVAGDAGKVSKYDATTGAEISSLFVQVPQNANLDPVGNAAVAVSGNRLFVSTGAGPTNTARVGIYDATTGQAINTDFITGLQSPSGSDDTIPIAVSGNDLYVLYGDAGTVGKYDATTGMAINASLFAGDPSSKALAVFGNNVYVAESNNVAVYDATTGDTTNPSFIVDTVLASFGLSSLAFSGNSLFAANRFPSAAVGSVAEFDAFTGATINPFFIPDLGYNTSSGPFLAVATPEPASAVLLLGGGALFALRRRRSPAGV